MTYVSQNEKAWMRSQRDDADAQAERRFQIEQSPLYKALVDLLALAEETQAQFARNGQTSYAHMTCEEIDLDRLAEIITDQLGGSDAPYAVDTTLQSKGG